MKFDDVFQCYRLLFYMVANHGARISGLILSKLLRCIFKVVFRFTGLYVVHANTFFSLVQEHGNQTRWSRSGKGIQL